MPRKARGDSFVAFHFFEKEVDLGEVLVTAGINVGERADGMYEYTAYGLGHSQQEVWAKRKASDAPGNEPGTEAFEADISVNLDSILGEDGDGSNIVILKVIDKATGERLTELEDVPAAAPAAEGNPSGGQPEPGPESQVAAQEEYPLGKTQEDLSDEFFGSRVTIDLGMGGRWSGTVYNSLKNGRLLEVARDGSEHSRIRVRGEQVVAVNNLVRRGVSEAVGSDTGEGQAEPGTQLDYTKMFEPTVIKEMNVIKHLRDSVLAAQHEGNSKTNIESDRILSLFVDTLTPQQFKSYDHGKAEEVLFARLHEIERELGLGAPPDPQKDADRALFQSVIDGAVADILAPDLADDLEAAYTRNQDDADLTALFEQAVTAYQAAMMAATSSLA